MANGTVELIRAAELEAEGVRKKAQADAAGLVAAAKARGEALIESTGKKTDAEIASMRMAVTEKSEHLIEKSRSEAEAETAELRKVARMRMRAAADEIIRGIDKQCQ